MGENARSRVAEMKLAPDDVSTHCAPRAPALVSTIRNVVASVAQRASNRGTRAESDGTVPGSVESALILRRAQSAAVVGGRAVREIAGRVVIGAASYSTPARRWPVSTSRRPTNRLNEGASRDSAPACRGSRAIPTTTTPRRRFGCREFRSEQTVAELDHVCRNSFDPRCSPERRDFIGARRCRSPRDRCCSASTPRYSSTCRWHGGGKPRSRAPPRD